MPELFRVFGFVFLIYSRDHGPVHVQVRGHDGEAKYHWDGEGFGLERSVHIKAGDLRRIERVIAENADLIIARWYEIFPEHEDGTDQEDMV
ncbi:MAG: DUF4160 domain-containing protein [Bacteroidales bacterium]|nr:DUF4160 domain-containing protein [Bacteroidales bacterium]